MSDSASHDQPVFLTTTSEEDLLLPNFSDDLDALHELEAESILEKTRQGIVIQHRHWKVTEVFRSDDDKSFGRLCAI